MKRFDGINNDGGMFQDRNPAQAKLGSVLDASWLNMMQDEVINVIEGAGITLDGTKTTQLSDAITKIINDYSIASQLPIPNVWAPLKGNLSLLCGFNTAMDTISVNGTDYQVAGRILTFSRPTTATYINVNGDRVSAKINEPRFEKRGLLVEGPSTNRIPNTNTLPTAYNTIITADGEWAKIIETATDTSHTASYASITPTAIGLYTFSIDLKPLDAGVNRFVSMSIDSTGIAVNHRATFDLVTGTFTEQNSPVLVTMEPLNGGAWRCALTFNLKTVGVVNISVRLSDRNADGLQTYVGDGISGCMARAPQFESQPFATSFIPTAGSPVTRGTDALSLPWLNNLDPIIDIGNKYTLSMKFSLMGNAKIMNTLYRYLFNQLSPNGIGNFIARVNKPDPNADMAFYRSGGTGTVKIDIGTSNQSGVLVARVKPDNFITLRINSITVNGNSPAAPSKSGLPTTLGIGGASNGSFSIFGHISDLRIWNEALTDIQMEGIV